MVSRPKGERSRHKWRYYKLQNLVHCFPIKRTVCFHFVESLEECGSTAWFPSKALSNGPLENTRRSRLWNHISVHRLRLFSTKIILWLWFPRQQHHLVYDSHHWRGFIAAPDPSTSNRRAYDTPGAMDQTPLHNCAIFDWESTWTILPEVTGWLSPTTNGKDNLPGRGGLPSKLFQSIPPQTDPTWRKNLQWED